MPPVRLLEPSLDLLDRYAAALRHGFAPRACSEHALMELAAIERDPRGFVQARLDGPERRSRADGTATFRLHRWIMDVVTCDTVGGIEAHATRRRSRPGRVDLTLAVAPWWRRRGYAGAALTMVLDVLRERDVTDVRLAGNIRDDGGWEVGPLGLTLLRPAPGAVDPTPRASPTGAPPSCWDDAA